MKTKFLNVKYLVSNKNKLRENVVKYLLTLFSKNVPKAGLSSSDKFNAFYETLIIIYCSFLKSVVFVK